MRVLVVDDQEVVRTGLRTILSAEADLELVGEAANGQEAVAAARSLQPDVVLMDIRMPVLDGITATRRIVEAGLPSRVCVLTTYGTDENVYHALVAGASGFCVKTDPPERIVGILRAVAAGEYALGTTATQHLVSRYLSGSRPTGTGDPLATLTPREREVFTLVAEGLTNHEIAARLYLGEGTVKTHVARILAKLGLRDRVQVVVFAHREGVA